MDSVGHPLDEDDQDNQSDQEGADVDPAAVGDGLDKRGTDAARAYDTEGRGVLQVDVKAVDRG